MFQHFTIFAENDKMEENIVKQIYVDTDKENLDEYLLQTQFAVILQIIEHNVLQCFHGNCIQGNVVGNFGKAV